VSYKLTVLYGTKSRRERGDCFRIKNKVFKKHCVLVQKILTAYLLNVKQYTPIYNFTYTIIRHDNNSNKKECQSH
jgi:hypothetical protein